METKAKITPMPDEDPIRRRATVHFLRVQEEAEMVGLDRTQFVDEQIGERAILDEFFVSSSSSPASASVVVNNAPELMMMGSKALNA